LIRADQEAKITPESFMRASRTRWMMIYSNYKNIAADVPRYKVLNRTWLLNSSVYLMLCSRSMIIKRRDTKSARR